MDSSSALLRPRLRLFRRSPSPTIPDADATPPARSLFTPDDDEAPTPRVQPRPIASLDPDPPYASVPVPAAATTTPAETPAARLRALLARELRSPRNASPPSSDAESAAGPTRFGSSSSSVARESLKDIFSRALREPGDTPQKRRMRRNSFDGSSMEITPVVNNDKRHRRAARRSLSDEEAENTKSNRHSISSFRLSTAAAFDTLRARLVSSQSQLIDQNLPDPLFDQTSLPSMSTSNTQPHLRPPTSSQVNSTRLTLPLNNTTTHPSFQMSSQLASQSNLLEQDSEMHRAMGNVLNTESEASASPKHVPQSIAPPSDSRPSSSLGERKHSSELQHRRSSYELHSSTSSLVNTRSDREHNHQREREWNRPRLPSRSNTPEIHHRHSQEFRRRLSTEFCSPSHVKSLSHESAAGPAPKYRERRDSLASLRSFDDDHSSRPSSTSSQADYQDRISELDRERNHERGRQWNKRHPSSRPSSSLSTSSSHSPSHSHSHTHPPRSPSTTPYLTPTHASLQRNSSRTSLRSDSPASLASSRESLKEHEEEEKGEISHERERNWNSPRPQWAISKSPSTSHLRSQNKDNSPLRATSSLTRVGDSDGHQDASRVTTKPRSSLPRVNPSTPTSPALHKSRDRSDPGVHENTVGTTQSTPSNGLSAGKRLGAASKFGWNFAHNPLPPLELDDRGNHHKGTSSPASGSRPSSMGPDAVISSQIPVRSMKSFSSIGHAPSDMSLTKVLGDESSFHQDSRNGVTEHAELRTHWEPPTAGDLRSQEDMLLASDEESVTDLPLQSTTPKGNPPNLVPEEIETDAETEVLTLSSPLRAPASLPNEPSLQKVGDPVRPQTPNIPLKKASASETTSDTPAGTESQLVPSSEMTTSFALLTPPRQASFGSSILDFRTPSPPQDLPDLPGPPSSDDDAIGYSPTKDQHVDANSNFTLTKTPKPPGAWAATPLPPKLGRRSSFPTSLFPLDLTPPTSTSTPLSRASSLPPNHAETEIDNPGEDELVTPVGSLSRAKSLSLRTPAPPGAWLATPSQPVPLSNDTDQSQYGSLSRRKSLLKVRFDVAESETSTTEGHPNSPISAIRLTNPELPLPKHTTDRRNDSIEAVNEDPSSTLWAVQRPSTPEQPTTPISRESRSPRSMRKSPSVRLVDAYGRERVDEEGIDHSNGHADAERKATTSPSTPRRSLVRIVDAMGKEVDDAVQTPDPPEGRTDRLLGADISVVLDDTPIGHAEALARMRKTLKDLTESLNDADRSEDFELNSSHLEQLEEVSKVARLARNQLAHNLHLETTKQHDLRSDSNVSAWTRELLPVTSKKSWNPTMIYCGIIIQLLIVLAMWRYAHAEAVRLFYTTYYDPLYPEFTPIQGSSCFSGTLSTSRSWTMLDSYETIRREGWWSIGNEMIRAMRHIGEQAWERWGEQTHLERPT